MAQQQRRISLEPDDIEIAPGVVVNPERRRGKPTMAGSRITVEEVLRKLAAGRSVNDILASWPHLTRAQVIAAIAYAHQLVVNSAATPVKFTTAPRRDDFGFELTDDDGEDNDKEGGRLA